MRAIRLEYWWVTRARYVAGRGARAAIYQHDHFHEKYEAQARANITAALAQLERK